MREQKSFKTILPDEGKRLLINDTLHDKLIVGLNNKPQVKEIQVPSYLDACSSLEEIKQVMINQSKLNLAQYLEDNPLKSSCKYPEGRYYRITKEKQDQLTSTLASYMADILPQLVIGMSTNQISIENVEQFILTLDNLPQTLTWNDSGNPCEVYTYQELYQLKCEIMETVKPLVSIQQNMEVKIQESESIEDVLKIDISYSQENLTKYLNMMQETYDKSESIEVEVNEE